MDETTNEIQTPAEDTPPAPALEPLSPLPNADTRSEDDPLGLDPLGPIRRFGRWS